MRKQKVLKISFKTLSTESNSFCEKKSKFFVKKQYKNKYKIKSFGKCGFEKNEYSVNGKQCFGEKKKKANYFVRKQEKLKALQTGKK